MGFKLGSESRGYKSSKTHGPILRKKLGEGIMGEANRDGSIYIDSSIKKGSPLEKEVIRHEGKHADDMKSGKLDYSDNHIRYNGKSYHRKDGKIKYNGKWIDEGSKSFPWEKAAYNVNKK
jgi:hypothetical protein